MKKNTIDNSFVLYGYDSPAYFCDRVRETRDLIEALENGRNVTLLAPRRMGKTGLIQNAFHELRRRGDDKDNELGNSLALTTVWRRRKTMAGASPVTGSMASNSWTQISLCTCRAIIPN